MQREPVPFELRPWIPPPPPLTPAVVVLPDLPTLQRALDGLRRL